MSRTKTAIKMSKHIGNVIDPWDVLDKQGADAVRWYFYASARAVAALPFLSRGGQ